MNLVIDAGNTRTKVAIFEGDKMREKNVCEDLGAADTFLSGQRGTHLLVSAVTEAGSRLRHLPELTGHCFQLTPTLSLPLRNRYTTPETLGADRLAAACGAWQ